MVQVEVLSCERIRVSWLPPESQDSGGLPIISYRVCHNGSELCNFFRAGDEGKTEIHGLQPITKYVIKVSANNTLGWGVEGMGNNTTLARMSKRLINVSKVTSNSITIMAEMIEAYTYLQCDLSPDADGFRNFTLASTPEIEQNLNFNTKYKIYCMALNINRSDACAEQTMNVTTRKKRELPNYAVLKCTHKRAID